MSRTVLGAACAVALAAGGLVLGGCSDPIALTVTVPEDPVMPDGKTGAKIEVSVTRGDQIVNAGTVAFSSSLDGTQFEQPIEDSSQMPGAEAQKTEVSVSAGAASVKLYSIAKGTAKVIITFTDENGSIATATKNVVFSSGSATTRIANVTFVTAMPGALLLAGSGGQTTSQVTFQVVDSGNAPVRDAQIDFELSYPLGGASLDPESAVTGDDGMVTTTLTSGSATGSLKVKAFTRDRMISGESDPITVAGSAANQAHFDFRCDRFAIGGFAASGLTMNCTAFVADRSGQRIPGYQVTFVTEAGSIPRYALTGAAESEADGAAVVVYTTQNPAPIDVSASLAYLPPELQPDGATDEPSVACSFDASKTCNPRDGLVTIIAVTTGEEEWNDTNGNGVCDDAELASLKDLPEPFVDANDNKKHDPTEYFIDANKNGSWDDMNGEWDSSTQIWRSTKIVWTGKPYFGHKGSKIYAEYEDSEITSISVPHCGMTPIRMLFVDDRLNRLTSQAGNSIACTCLDEACTSSPAEVSLGDDGGGRIFESVSIKDTHDCDEEAKSSVDQVTCTGVFQQDAEGRMEITMTVPDGRPLSAVIDQ